MGGGLKANALLTGVAVAWLTSGTLLTLPIELAIAATAAAMATILAIAIERTLSETILPTLVWAYCLVAATLFSLFPVWTELSVNIMTPWPVPYDLFGFGTIFLRSLGSLLFVPDVVAGVVVGIAILLWSRTMFITGVVGWISGVVAAIAFQKLGLNYYWPPVSYNFFFAGMALGSAFFLPGRPSLIMAIMSGFAASFFALVLQFMLHGSASAYLPIPIALTIWIGIGVLSRSGGKSLLWRNTSMERPPEEAWWHAAHWTWRFGRDEPLMMIPVAGPVQVTQGFNGSLSHVGLWRHALDFQKPLAAGGSEESIWRAPVTAPSAVTVERTVSTIPDNPLGVSNFAENWGNYTVIHLDQGDWAMLAHLRQGTVTIPNGIHVEAGTYIAEDGNSGRSPIPHLHLQVQSSPEPGAPTVPFLLANFQSADETGKALLHWNAAGVPSEGEIVMASMPNPAVHSILASMAPGSTVWTIETEGQVPHAFRQPRSSNIARIKITLDEAGRHLLSADKGGTIVTALAPDAWRIIESRRVSAPFLKMMGLALPSVPYAATKGMSWDDAALFMPSGLIGQLSLCIAPYFSGQPFPLVQCTCVAAPGTEAENNVFKIETTVLGENANLPVKLTCELQAIKGLVKLHADFKDGTVTYSLLSFEPSLPFAKEAVTERPQIAAK